MALRRAVVVSSHAVQGMGVKHRERAMLCRRDGDLCIESLRSAQMHRKLAHAARSYVDRFYLIERSGRPLLQTLGKIDLAEASYALAA